jgi:CheY-like chemotaxis protein
MEKILIADDNAGARALLKNVFESRGYDVTTTSGGMEALQQLDEQAPDLMLLDIRMQDGCQVCSYVKNRPGARKIPVVVIGGVGDTADRASQAGADGFLRKPFSLDTLLTEVRRHVLGPPAEVDDGAWLSNVDCVKLCAAGT